MYSLGAKEMNRVSTVSGSARSAVLQSVRKWSLLGRETGIGMVYLFWKSIVCLSAKNRRFSRWS